MNTQDVLFYSFLMELIRHALFLWLVAKARPGAIYQNNLLSEGNLLLTDKSLPSAGCNGSHLSSFSEYCPSRPPPRQTRPTRFLCVSLSMAPSSLCARGSRSNEHDGALYSELNDTIRAFYSPIYNYHCVAVVRLAAGV